MRQILIIANHSITDTQQRELREMGVTIEQKLPDDLKQVWQQIDPNETNIEKIAEPFMRWIEETFDVGDLLFIQGDFGMTTYLVSFAIAKGLDPIYATSKRVYTEYRSGEEVYQTHVFRHNRFRHYKLFPEASHE